MKQFKFDIVGLSPLLLNHCTLKDPMPLDEGWMSRLIPDQEHVCLKWSHVKGALRTAAKFFDVCPTAFCRLVFVHEEHMPLLVDGQSISVDELKDDGGHGLTIFKARLLVGGELIERSFPCLEKWSCRGHLSVLDDQFMPVVAAAVEHAGRIAGLGHWRPGLGMGDFGQFVMQLSEL